MPKPKEQLEAAGYSDFYWFGEKYRWTLVVLLSAIVCFAVFAYHWIIDPNFHADWKHLPRCHGRGCGYALLIYGLVLLFLSLPVWLKFPTAFIAFVERVYYLIRRLIWTLDRHPDLAIGKNGVYFPKKLKYLELNWSEISKVEVVRIRNEKKNKTYPPTIKFYGFGRTERTLRDVGPLTDPVHCTIPSRFGFEQEAIIAAIRDFAPGLAVTETKHEID